MMFAMMLAKGAAHFRSDILVSSSTEKNLEADLWMFNLYVQCIPSSVKSYGFWM